MEYKLNDILNLSEAEMYNSKIELNMKAGKNGESYIDRWLKLSDSIKESGITDCSFWSWYSANQRNFNKGNTVFSFIQISAIEWLFISAAEILDTPKLERATVYVVDKFKPLFGRLIIKHKKGQTFSRYVFNMISRIDDCIVKEILPCIYSGETFNGYDNVNIKYAMLKAVFQGEIMPSYYEALQQITGVYCLTDHHTGKQYIGSATGTGGVLQRWGDYLETGHGGNVKLIELCNSEEDGYFEDNFTFTLLEYFGMMYDPVKIVIREQYWKKCFGTIKNGYNDN